MGRRLRVAKRDGWKQGLVPGRTPCVDGARRKKCERHAEEARKALQQVFPEREVIGINCLPLIKQHGSLHCVTMQYPEGFIR